MKKSIEYAEFLKDKTPNDKDPYLMLADLYWIKKEYKKSSEFCRKVLEIDPNNSLALNRMRALKQAILKSK